MGVEKIAGEGPPIAIFNYILIKREDDGRDLIEPVSVADARRTWASVLFRFCLSSVLLIWRKVAWTRPTGPGDDGRPGGESEKIKLAVFPMKHSLDSLALFLIKDLLVCVAGIRVALLDVYIHWNIRVDRGLCYY
ncbi:hypothetical protein GWI33_003210 [Rhynchophorus ferrugineus]|uniref:Uncharacterized protein n=1 Tax=Rhynchophorus ferrugineus TaxID=354439 RepID=A0A834IZ57_RHYFE|nr:hypothetical protein GWI33_003210 [Rhynchophorus ferrugineus]